MGNLTANLSTSEFVCHCGCGQVYVADETAKAAQFCRDHFQDELPDWDVRIKVTSGTRCAAWNQHEGGSVISRHLLKWATFEESAIDFYLYDGYSGTNVRIDATEVAKLLEAKYATSCGIGRYNGRTHFDNRAAKARWDSRSL